MILKVYSVLDVKSGTYGVPFFIPNEVQAKRTFTGWCLDESSTLFKFPGDFSLVYIGEYDDSNGHFENVKFVDLGKASVYKNAGISALRFSEMHGVPPVDGGNGVKSGVMEAK